MANKDLTSMTVNELCELAQNIFKGHDFYYMMVDYGYASAAVSAQASMRYFVEVTNLIGGELREAFRKMWIAGHDYYACFRPGWTDPDHKEKEAAFNEAKAELAALLPAPVAA